VTIRGLVQASDLGAEVTLYELDLSMFGMGIVRLTPGHTGSGLISFQGEQYAPHPIEADGFELTTTGTLPRPDFLVSNVENTFTALVEQHDDLQGAILTRLRTYETYLDDGATPGPDMLPPDVYLLSQKAKHTDTEIQWVCVAQMDQEGVALPARQIVRDWCGHDTRVWDGTGFDYTNVTCPYTGPPKDEAGLPSDPWAEVFSKRLGTCCKARFGAKSVLPTRAFPGVARLRSR
jgi:lambda family phage minor tail protein L